MVAPACAPYLKNRVLELAYFLHHQFLESRHPEHQRRLEEHLPHCNKFDIVKEDLADILQESQTENVAQNLISCVVLLHFRMQVCAVIWK